jgi:vesicle-associated membrane protein 72
MPTFSRPKLKEHMKYCDQHPEEIDKLAKVKAQVTEVKGVMMQNIEKVWLFYCQLDT